MQLPWKRGRFRMLLEAARGRYLSFTLAVLTTAITFVFSFTMPQIIRNTIDSVLDDNPWELPAFIANWLDSFGGREFFRTHLWYIAAAAIFVGLMAAIFNILRRYFNLELAEYIAQKLRNTLYKHIQSLPFKWHAGVQTGDIIQRSTSDVDTIRNFFANHVVELLRTVFTIVFALLVMFSMDWVMSLVAISLMPFIFFFSVFYFKSVAKTFKVADEAEGALQAAAQENFTGVRVVRAFGRERFEVEQFEKKNTVYANSGFVIGKLLGQFWGFGDIMAGLQLVLVVAAGIIRCSSGELTAGTFIAFYTYTNFMIWPVRGLGRILSELSKTTVSAGRIKEILEAEPEYDAPDAITPPIKGEVRFENVSFSYSENETDHLLKDISFTLKPGKTLAILGSTGSGKTTLVHLINRLFELPEGQGRILIDGIDVKRYSREHLRKNVGLVLQEPFLFSKTIKENINFTASNASDEDTYNAANIAHVHDTILGFGGGYDTMIGERGVTLSGGQKQRVAIARMLMSKAPIMIFDDSLSAVDTETDARIRKALRNGTKDASVIIISHRTSTLMQADEIMVLHDGRIEELGSHEQLMANSGSYRRIFDMQGSIEAEME